LSGNEFLQIGTALGIPGVIILLLIFIVIIKNSPELGGHRKAWSASAGAYFAVIGMLISCLFNNTLHYAGLLLTFVVLVSLLSKEKYSISTIPKEALFFVKIYYFIYLIFAFIIFSLVIRPAMGHLLTNYYDKTQKIRFLDNAIRVEPFNGEHFFKKGILFEKAKIYDEAVKNYLNVCKVDKKNYDCLRSLGRSNAESGDISSALKFYELSVKYNPFNVFTYYDLASLYYFKLNDVDVAEKYLIKSITYEPNYVSARHLLALILKQRSNQIQALNQYDEIEKILAKNTPETEYEKSLLDFPVEILYLNKALIFKDIGDFEQAVYYYKKYYELNKDENVKKIIKQLNKKGIKN
jgi:tetratricopeptide (TPR) repeat protein